MSSVRLEERDGGIRLVTLDDPERRNAMSAQMGEDLITTLRQVDQDPEARVCVLTGAGSAFCAGADLPAMFGDAAQDVRATHERLQGYYAPFFVLHDMALPTVAAVNGPAVGAGLNLAMAADMRVAGPDATFAATFTRIGLHPGGGCTYFLVRALGGSRALRALLLGESIKGPQACALGLAEGPEEDPLAAALDLAGHLSEVDPLLARHTKKAVRIAVETDDLRAVLEYESWAQAASASSEQLQEWVARFRR